MKFQVYWGANLPQVNIPKIILINDEKVWEDFKELVRRGINSWADASADMKELADIVTEGKVQQNYREMMDFKKDREMKSVYGCTHGKVKLRRHNETTKTKEYVCELCGTEFTVDWPDVPDPSDAKSTDALFALPGKVEDGFGSFLPADATGHAADPAPITPQESSE